MPQPRYNAEELEHFRRLLAEANEIPEFLRENLQVRRNEIPEENEDNNEEIMKEIDNVTVGADPELFVINSKTGKVVSAVDLIPGVKGAPWADKSWPEGYGMEIDNILGEFNIPPARTCKDFVKSINFMKDRIREHVQKQNPDLDIMHCASTTVPKSELQSDVAKLFGCSVDYNAYTEAPNPRPCGEKTTLRSSGFHVHVGYTNANTATSLKGIKYMDMFLGLPSVIMDSDTRRRSLYGKAGCFRLTGYGFEYRVLSGLFLKDDEKISFVYNNTIRAINALNNGVVLPPAEKVIEAINNSDAKLAEELISKYNIEY